MIRLPGDLSDRHAWERRYARKLEQRVRVVRDKSESQLMQLQCQRYGCQGASWHVGQRHASWHVGQRHASIAR